jgi:hypothetical protein
LEAIRLVGNEPELRDMFANLLASSMDSSTAASAHPAFVEIIRQMVPEEAKLFEHLAIRRVVPLIMPGIATQDQPGRYEVSPFAYVTSLAEDAGIPDVNIGTHIGNLIRLGLAAVHRDYSIEPHSVYEALAAKGVIRAFIENARQQGKQPALMKHALGLTPAWGTSSREFACCARRGVIRSIPIHQNR